MEAKGIETICECVKNRYFYMVSYKNLYGKRKEQSGSVTILGTEK